MDRSDGHPRHSPKGCFALFHHDDQRSGNPISRFEGPRSRYAKLVVELKVSQTSDAQVFWSTSSTPGMSESASLHAQAPGDGRFHRLVFDLGGNEHWGGCLTGLRFDPTSAEGVLVEIRRIRLQ